METNLLPAHLNISNHALCYLKITLTIFTPLQLKNVYTDIHICTRIYTNKQKKRLQQVHVPGKPLMAIA